MIDLVAAQNAAGIFVAVVQDHATTAVDTTALATLVSLFVPLVVSVFTKQSASDGLRSVVNIVASAVVAVAALWINPSDGNITMAVVVNTLVLSLVASFTAYKAIWKPTGVAGTVTSKTADFGLGSPPVLETADKGAEDRGQVDADPREV